MLLYLYKTCTKMIIVYFCGNDVISILVRFFVCFSNTFCFTRQISIFVPTTLLLTNVYAYLSGIHIARDLKTFFMADLGTWGKLGHFFFFSPSRQSIFSRAAPPIIEMFMLYCLRPHFAICLYCVLLHCSSISSSIQCLY